jgi:hypothetical protein
MQLPDGSHRSESAPVSDLIRGLWRNGFAASDWCPVEKSESMIGKGGEQFRSLERSWRKHPLTTTKNVLALLIYTG